MASRIATPDLFTLTVTGGECDFEFPLFADAELKFSKFRRKNCCDAFFIQVLLLVIGVYIQ